MRQIACALGIAILMTTAAGCGKKKAASTAEVIATFHRNPPAEPEDPDWEQTPAHIEPLLMQDLVEPRLVEPSTPEVILRAFTDGARIVFRIEWEDATRDDLPSAGRFPDTCAVQLPELVERDAPDPQMGGPGRPVGITFWSAFWQSSRDGREDTINSIYPQATVDHYPFQAPSLQPESKDQTAMALRYAPARTLGNPMSGPKDKVVQDLVAEGPGTLTPATETTSSGKGVRTEKGWIVVISRPVPRGVAVGGQAQVAVAVADGSRKEGGSRKMRSAWIPLVLEEER